MTFFDDWFSTVCPAVAVFTFLVWIVAGGADDFSYAMLSAVSVLVQWEPPRYKKNLLSRYLEL